MGVKALMKKILPAPVIEVLKKGKRAVDSRYLALAGAKRFQKWSAYADRGDVPRMEPLLTFFTHQLEKGFTYDTYQYGRSRGVLKSMSDLMARIRRVDPHYQTNVTYREAVAALGEYRRRHLAANKDISFMSQMFSAELNKEIEASSQHDYPSTELLLAGKEDNARVGFVELVERRHAVRTYADKPVVRADLEKVVEISLRTPSVCNRQSVRVRIIDDAQTIGAALKIQGGFGGYAMPPALMLITSDLRAFMGPQEHNEPFVDGGLFSMSLLYALEAERLAACPLNAMFGAKADVAMRKLLHIPDNEVFVMFIAIGHFRETSRICLSRRLPLEHVLLQ